ncbi:hypothetical protein PHYPO_G00195660 [Pangasianodon hypophthalmus]|uniref:Uncharacterized protein n=1 Tax=Pangasianodon hypophthalmus TaxID=310915 RepID=A0A5N5PIP2_PANHP|nr:hypothetical protein PHYPO_G00195660 [Pangasianodon hypophthalmus]
MQQQKTGGCLDAQKQQRREDSSAVSSLQHPERETTARAAQASCTSCIFSFPSTLTHTHAFLSGPNKMVHMD